jgi:nitrogen fixation protein FixH
VSTACIPNIGPRERQRRLVVGVVMLGIAVTLAVVLVMFGAPRVWRLLVVAPAWIAGIGLFQVKEKTCVALAARGLRNLDHGDERIVDAIELQHVRAQSRKVHAEAIAFALAFVVVVLLLPVWR